MTKEPTVTIDIQGDIQHLSEHALEPKKESEIVAVGPAGATPVALAPVSQMMVFIERALSNPRMSVDKMREAFELQKDFMAMHAEIQFNEAMARLQPKLPFIDKKGRISFEDSKGNQRNTPFARFEDIEEAIRPLYTTEGFSTSYDIESIAIQGSAPMMIVVLTIAHSLGHKRQFRSPPMPADNSGKKNPIQALGSTQSYGKRYCLTNGFGIVVKGEDDDAKKGGAETKPKDQFAANVEKAARNTTVRRGEREIITEAENLREDLKSLTFKKERSELLSSKLQLLRELEGLGRGDVVKTLHAVVDKGKVPSDA